LEFRPFVGEIKRRSVGSMVSGETGKALGFSLANLQQRGALYIGASTQVYQGQVIGNTSRGDEMTVNPIKGKHLTNMRASGSDDALNLTPPIPITIDRKYTYLNNIEPEDNLSGRLAVSKRFGKLKARISGNYAISNTNRLTFNTAINTQKTKYTTQNYTASITTNFNEWPNFEIGYKTSINEQNGLQSINHKPYGNIEVSFLKNFILTADYTYNQFTDSSDKTNIYDFLNADLYYQKEGSKWEFHVAAINLLDTKSINDNYFSTDFVATSQYIVQPRYLMFSVKYDL